MPTNSWEVIRTDGVVIVNVSDIGYRGDGLLSIWLNGRRGQEFPPIDDGTNREFVMRVSQPTVPDLVLSPSAWIAYREVDHA